MASLNSLLAKAKIPTASSIARDIKSQVGTSISATRNEIRNIPGSIAQAGVAQAKGAVSSAVNTGVVAVRNAASQALKGDFSGALSTLSKGPQDALGTFGAGFGLSTSGGTLGANGGQTNTLQGALSRADPMMSFQWYCELPMITPIGGTPVGLDWNYVEEATPAFRTYDVRQMYAQARQHKFPGSYSVNDLRLTFYAGVDNTALRYLMAWDGAILAPFSASQAAQGGGMGRPSDYKKPIRIYCVDSARSLVLMFEYTDCWPNMDGIQLDSGSSTRITFGVNFSVGDVFVTAFGVNNNMSGAGLLDALKTGATAALSGAGSLVDNFTQSMSVAMRKRAGLV